jgi:hypothetical protein
LPRDAALRVVIPCRQAQRRSPTQMFKATGRRIRDLPTTLEKLA